VHGTAAIWLIHCLCFFEVAVFLPQVHERKRNLWAFSGLVYEADEVRDAAQQALFASLASVVVASSHNNFQRQCGVMMACMPGLMQC
jgi:hypothetical protein